MSNAFYNSARHDIPAGTMGWTTSDWFAVLVDPGYTYDPAHDTLADVSSFVLSGVTAQPLTGLAESAGGVCSANSLSFTGVGAGQTANAVVIYQDLGGGVTRLFLFIDSGANFPLATTGAAVAVDWNNTPVNGTIWQTN